MVDKGYSTVFNGFLCITLSQTFAEQLNISNAERYRDSLVLCYLDLNAFKVVNKKFQGAGYAGSQL